MGSGVKQSYKRALRREVAKNLLFCLYFCRVRTLNGIRGYHVSEMLVSGCMGAANRGAAVMYCLLAIVPVTRFSGVKTISHMGANVRAVFYRTKLVNYTSRDKAVFFPFLRYGDEGGRKW
jgi:hypothetical protein